MILSNKKILLILSFGLLLLPFTSFAQTGYTPLVDSGLTSDGNFNDFINNLYTISISLAALLAVVKIIIGGVKWSLSDIVTTKESAKNDIQNAIFGLVIIIGAVLVLNIINPDLTDINVSFPNQRDVAVTEVPNTVVRECPVVDGTPNCSQIEENCQRAGSMVQTNISSDGKTITCQRPSSSRSIVCAGLGFGRYNCDPAITECESAGGEVKDKAELAGEHFGGSRIVCGYYDEE